MTGIVNHVHDFHQPEERDDPRNALLDLFDQTLMTLKAFDCDAQVRARFAKHFPAPSAPDIEVDEPIDMLETRLLIDACKRGAKFSWPDSLHNARKRIQAGAERELARMLKERRAAQ